jgi:hypothetical protein
MRLKPGDIFFLLGTTWIDAIINLWQAVTGGDKRSSVTHCGVILNAAGDTQETTSWRCQNLNIFQDHPGSLVYIFRPLAPPEKLQEGIGSIKDQLGKIYPYHRWFLFVLGLAQHIHWRAMVCSEQTARHLAGAGLREAWWGISPDRLFDWAGKLTVNFWLVYFGRPIDMKQE